MRIPMTRSDLGELLVSTTRYALARSWDATLCESARTLIMDYMHYVLFQQLKTLIRDIQRRGDVHTPGTSHTEHEWEKTLDRLEGYRDDGIAPKPLPNIDVRLDDLVLLLALATRYALGRSSSIVRAMRVLIRKFAPRLCHDDRRSLANDLQSYLDDSRPHEHACDKQAWQETLVFLYGLDRKP